MTEPAPERIIGAAETEYQHVTRLYDAHKQACTAAECGECESLAGHLRRCERQIELLAPGVAAETGPLF